MISDELLKDALMLSLEETVAFHKRACEDNPHRFSIAYKIRRRSIIRLAEHYETRKLHHGTEKPHTERHFIPLKRLALFIAIIAAAVVLSVGAYAAYLIINGFVFDVHEEYSRVTLDTSEYELKNTITELYWLPPESGCESIIEIHDDETAMTIYYQNENTIVLGQYTKFAVEHFVMLNTEDANVYSVKINENNGFISIRPEEGVVNDKEVVWIMDGYVFYISCETITVEELIKFAESVVIKEKPK